MWLMPYKKEVDVLLENAGVLYLCATPIGNLEDMTYRAVRVLSEVEVIAAEDTRHTRKLLSHFDIHTRLISYHEHNKVTRGPEIIERLITGENVAVVSDAGLPGISDPGSDLVELAVQAGIRVVPLPGANAALSALVSSGLDTTLFSFLGFLPKNKKKRRELLASFANSPYTMVYYESPHRIKQTLAELKSAFGDRPAVAARELTKKFEEFIRGTIESLVTHFAENDPRGEFTLIVGGHKTDQSLEADTDEQEQPSIEDAVIQLMESGVNKKEAIKTIAQQRGLPKREVYQATLEIE
ncbi:16S rRNA (cytidine(1402)-2'-O)-methyltransferase [Pelosinus baikalensis]|uniref:Ribosomal RNA small subunit methyltransferase I n=1 Tax=Pelosinus baikalensis TaxID=2892015 RepID=A0ABS8HWZ0_9FIRM|nr:16S rRNA (cytidine(1402)-2'-O)-methyltransferase [Pelosinus baikalensis]MCC5467675.1 16S rRNA (cytidine(1402)-2'-O)-methyltransferase [Pelosinus baikalensis]